MDKRIVEGHAAERTLGCPHAHLGAEQQANFRLLSLGDQKRHHANGGGCQSLTSDVPAISRTPVGVAFVLPAKRAPHGSARDILAPFQQFAGDAAGGQLRVNVAAFFFDGLERPFAFDEACQPSPICDLIHADQPNIFTVKSHPEYAELARRRIEGDASLFTEVVAA